MSEESAGAIAAVPPRAVDIEAIERELDRLLFDPIDEASEEQAIGLRACMANLLIYVPTRAEAERIQGDVGVIAQRHPSRVIMLVGESANGDLAAYVSAVCHLGEGGKQICSEHIVVEAAGSVSRRLPSIARSLVIGDLPTSLWWAASSPPPLAGDVFLELSTMAAQVIYDGAAWADEGRALVLTAEWATSGARRFGLSDLVWTRLRSWRSLVAQALDPSCAPGALASLRDVVVEHDPRSAVFALLLVGWLAERLGWKPLSPLGPVRPHASWHFTSASGAVRVEMRPVPDAPAGLAGVEIAWGDAGATLKRLKMAALDAGRLAILGDAGDPRRVVAAPDREIAQLVARELPELGRDRSYRRALEMARSLVHGALG